MWAQKRKQNLDHTYDKSLFCKLVHFCPKGFKYDSVWVLDRIKPLKVIFQPNYKYFMYYQQGNIAKTGVSQAAQFFVSSHSQQINQIFGTYHNNFLVIE